MCVSAQDAAARVVKFARELEKEAPNRLRGISLVGKVNLAHAEERLHHLIRQWGLTVPVRIDICQKMLLCEKVLLSQPLVLPTSWIQHLLRCKPQLLLGGFRLQHTLTSNFLQAFWRMYRMEHPTHTVFQEHSHRLDHCIPYTLFGDEGRGLRKSPIMIMAMEAIFGQSTFSAVQEALDKGGAIDDLLFLDCMAHTGKGNSLNSRFLLYALPYTLYRGKKRKGFWYTCFDMICSDCRDAFYKGVQVGDETYYAVCLGIKGDSPAQAKAGSLTRTFARLGHLKGICAQCLAGTGAWSAIRPVFLCRNTIIALINIACGFDPLVISVATLRHLFEDLQGEGMLRWLRNP